MYPHFWIYVDESMEETVPDDQITCVEPEDLEHYWTDLGGESQNWICIATKVRYS